MTKIQFCIDNVLFLIRVKATIEQLKIKIHLTIIYTQQSTISHGDRGSIYTKKNLFKKSSCFFEEVLSLWRS